MIQNTILETSNWCSSWISIWGLFFIGQSNEDIFDLRPKWIIFGIILKAGRFIQKMLPPGRQQVFLVLLDFKRYNFIITLLLLCPVMVWAIMAPYRTCPTTKNAIVRAILQAEDALGKSGARIWEESFYFGHTAASSSYYYGSSRRYFRAHRKASSPTFSSLNLRFYT